MALPPLQNLLDLLPDNTQGLIEPNDLRSITTDLYAGIVANGDTLLGYVRTDGAVTMDDGYEPSATLSVATKGYVDSVLFPKNFVQITGSQMSGDLFLPLYLPTEYTQAAHKGYVDSAVSAGVQGVVTTDTTNYKLITETPEGVKVRGLKASQNVVLTDDGTDITIKANVAGTGGDVRTDVSNVYDANTVQTFADVVASTVVTDSAIVNGVNVEVKNDEQDDALGQESDARIAAITQESDARIAADALLSNQIDQLASEQIMFSDNVAVTVPQGIYALEVHSVIFVGSSGQSNIRSRLDGNIKFISGATHYDLPINDITPSVKSVRFQKGNVTTVDLVNENFSFNSNGATAINAFGSIEIIGNQNIKLVNTTSSGAGQLLFAWGRLTKIVSIK